MSSVNEWVNERAKELLSPQPPPTSPATYTCTYRHVSSIWCKITEYYCFFIHLFNVWILFWPSNHPNRMEVLQYPCLRPQRQTVSSCANQRGNMGRAGNELRHASLLKSVTQIPEGHFHLELPASVSFFPSACRLKGKKKITLLMNLRKAQIGQRVYKVFLSVQRLYLYRNKSVCVWGGV